MFYDPTYIFVIIGALISMIASINVKLTFNKYSHVVNSRGVRAHEVAETILHSSGIYDVKIEKVEGNLTDHYSPTDKILRLSTRVYNSESVAAIGVAAHECGHAIQHNTGYAPLRLRSLAVPVVNIGSRLSWPLIIIGLVLGSLGLAKTGVILFFLVVLFQLITLPIEFNASRRALSILNNQTLLVDDELTGARKVLIAAALTYVAALFSSILQMLRLLVLVNNRNNRR
ncbi:MAG: zinc metallopeptidase [Oscillospiraceae bacterium]|nr:zinc metallopeptidase [Oscillospiraceae bacterium]